jgi:uncharacterized OsmC-like protein
MDAETLKALQAPLKAKYKEDPASARVTMHARATVEGDAIACILDIDRNCARAGLHPAAGGTGEDLCSGDMLLEALVGCAGVTLKAVATAMGIAIDRAQIIAEGDCDFRGTLGVDKAVPVGFSDIRLRFEVRSSAPADQIAQLIKLTERYCVVYQTLKSPPPVAVTAKTQEPQS